MNASGSGLEQDWLDEQLPAGVQLGEGAWLYSAFAFLHAVSELPVPVRVGAHSGVYDGTFFELGPAGSVSIGEYCSIVGAIIATDADVRIGDRCLIAHDVVIADTEFSAPLIATSGRSRGASLGDDVWVGTAVSIIGPVSIGDGSIIAAGSVVTSDVPSGVVAAGQPARTVRRIGAES